MKSILSDKSPIKNKGKTEQYFKYLIKNNFNSSDFRGQELEEVIDFVKEKGYPSWMSEIDIFKEYYAIGIMYDMNRNQALCFVGTVLNSRPKDIMETIKTYDESYDKHNYQADFKAVCKKLGVEEGKTDYRREKVKELAETIKECDDHERILAITNPDITADEKIAHLKAHKKERDILELVKNDPEVMLLISKKLSEKAENLTPELVAVEEELNREK